MAKVNCPKCGNEADALQPVDKALLEKLKAEGQGAVPAQVCLKCFSLLAGSIARGSVLMAHEKAKEQHKLMLWKSRVGMVRSGRALMSQKSFSDAAVIYEKYIRVLEVIFEADSTGLKPDHFKDNARTQELTILVSVYWDLLRIYDTSSRYGERMKKAATKLAQFLKYTPIYPDILKKAKAFERSAKNPAVVRMFLKDASEAKGRCFIATSAFQSYECEEVVQLRLFRDLVLEKSDLGRRFVKKYYQVSPGIAQFLDASPRIRAGTKFVLMPIAKWANFSVTLSCFKRDPLPKSSQHAGTEDTRI